MPRTLAQIESRRRYRVRRAERDAAGIAPNPPTPAKNKCASIQRSQAKQRRLKRENEELLLTCKRENSVFIYHPALELLPRIVPNPIQESIHEAESLMLDASASVGIDCQYEPFLFQMFDHEIGGRLATSPDLWLVDEGLIIEIGYIPNKSRKIRNLRLNFPNMRFGIIPTKSVLAMPVFEAAEDFLTWVYHQIELSDAELSRLSRADVAAAAYRRAIAEGANPKAAAARAKRALKKL